MMPPWAFRLMLYCYILLTISSVVVAVVGDEEPTVGALFDAAIIHAKSVADVLMAGNIARIAYTLYLYSVNKYICTLEAIGE